MRYWGGGGGGGGGGRGGGGQKFLFWWGGLYCWGKVNFVGGDHVILKLKLKLHKTSIKSIFGITNLIYLPYLTARLYLKYYQLGSLLR